MPTDGGFASTEKVRHKLDKVDNAEEYVEFIQSRRK